ncbi:MAG: MarR family transcriptional regulator [Gammaproteobacteria bacterium]|jgi:MarR family transcriptional regulator, organic hydroperoxide resistance regulator|nr:MarR family transcriptional regulator [Gammaproteobacteria bacterium]MBU0771850.1 MarR family transcriptional regulator [Gammaproteobacteria bacterium]MBU0856129.1 MarR family transcriptional regulator [Gammaproteobacteria bacterium]MBU1846168.1 MarR family transcriptional regulator [Gammaproteobacteria bacterium]
MTFIDPMLLDQQLCFALYAASHAITRSFSPGLKALGLTYPQYLVMLVLWQDDALTLKALADRLDLDSPTLTPLLKRLEASGYITRARSRADERALEILLTDAGRALRDRAEEVQAQVARQSGLPEDAMARMRSELHKLSMRLKGSDDPEPTGT